MSSKVFQFPRILILLLLITFANFLGLLITPALPEIAERFNFPGSMGTWIMALFLVGYSVGQLLYGPYANRFGRKPTITFGMLLALFGTILCYFSEEFWVFAVGRVIQALGAAVGLKIGFTIVGDLNQGGQATKALATLSSAFGIMPGIAIAIGGYITEMYGAEGCFIFLGIYTVFLWSICQILPETVHELNRDALKIKKVAYHYGEQFKDAYLVLYAFLAGLTSCILYIFSTVSPYLGMKGLALSPQQFGYWAILPSFGFLCGAITSRKMGDKYHPRINILSGILIILVATLVSSFTFATGHMNVWTLFIPTAFMYLGANLIWSNALSKGLTGAHDKSNASAVMQFVNMGTATIAVFIIQGFDPTFPMLFPASLGVLLILIFLCWFRLRAHH